jgi:outer membrane biosynthesis protein TonB
MTLVWPRFRFPWRQWLRSPLVIALLLSLVLHLYLFFMAWLVPQMANWKWLPSWAKPLVAAVSPPPKKLEAQARVEPQDVEIPLQFIEVDPNQSVADAPKDARYTSTANTLAANPTPAKTPVPRIDGRREDSLKTFDTQRPTRQNQPAVPQDMQEQQAKDEVKPQEKGGPKPGELALARPVPDAKVDREQEKRDAEKAQVSAPRKYKTVSQARAERGMIVGEQMKQEGGVPRVGVEPTFNVRATHFGEYSSRLTAAVQARWYHLLDERNYALERTGRVVITFKLHPDGSVSGISTTSSSVGEIYSLLCELAIEQPAPFGKWPPDLIQEIGRDPIPVTFTFNYFN